MAGCLVYSSIASTRSGVGLGARGATRVKLGPPNSGINSMRSRAAARDTTPERAGVSEISRVAGRATLSFLPTHRAQWLRLSGGPRGLLRLLYALDRGAGAGSGSGVAALPSANLLAVRFAWAKGALSRPRRWGVGRYAGAYFSASGPRTGDGPCRGLLR